MYLRERIWLANNRREIDVRVLSNNYIILIYDEILSLFFGSSFKFGIIFKSNDIIDMIYILYLLFVSRLIIFDIEYKFNYYFKELLIANIQLNDNNIRILLNIFINDLLINLFIVFLLLLEIKYIPIEIFLLIVYIILNKEYILLISEITYISR